jgi:hypothetical protein
MKRLIASLKTRLVAAVGVTAAFLVPLGLYGAPALARSAAAMYEYDHEHSGSAEYEYDDDDSGSAQYEYDVDVCHGTHSTKEHHRSVRIRVSSTAARAHLRHGDVLSRSSECPRDADDDRKEGKNGKNGKTGKDGHRSDQGKSDHGTRGGERGHAHKK